MDNLLHIENLSVGYKQKLLIENIATTVNTGDLIAIMGANGTGKSTLIKTLCGLHPSLSGTIILRGKKIDQLSARTISKQISLVLTNTPLINSITVYDFVSMGRYPYTNQFHRLADMDQQIIKNSLEKTNCLDIQNQLMLELSDGQKQKVIIARALAQDTPLLFLDEPSSFLDLNHKVILFQLLKSLVTDYSKTILFSTHDAQIALKVATKVWFINGSTINILPADTSILPTLLGKKTFEFIV